MEVFDVLESTIYAPMLGRIYVSEHFPDIFYDEKAIKLKSLIPLHPAGEKTQSEFTMLGTAIRNASCDRCIKEFLRKNNDGVIVNLGCGLDTEFFRCDNGRSHFYEVDLPEVINYRKLVIEETERDHLIEGDAFKPQWIQEIRKNHPSEPILIVASGLFQYFSKQDIKGLFKMLSYYGKIEFVFEAFNTPGMMGMLRFMKMMGYENKDNKYFTSDNNKFLAEDLGCVLVKEENLFENVPTKGLKFLIKLRMKRYNKKGFIKLVHLRVG